jgi:Type II secretion system (T2SS), protein E, N-terminal domain
MPPRKRLGQVLMELGVIDEHQLQSALGHQKQWGGKLGGILVQKGFCSEDDVVTALTKHLNMPRVKLAGIKVDPRALKCVSKQIAEKLHVLPYELSGSGRSEVVTIAMSDPTDLSAVDQLAFHTGKRVKTMLAGDSEIVAAILAHYGGPEEKKEPTDKVARPAGPNVAPGTPAGSVAGFPKRIDPPAPGGAATARATPYIPPPIPAAKSSPSQKLEEIEPDAALAPPAPAPVVPDPVDLPPDDGGDLGLEPIAAHSQFGDAVAGQEEVLGEGTAADAVEGLVSASLAHHDAGEAAAADRAPVQEALAWHAQVSAAEGWDTPAPDAAPRSVSEGDGGWGEQAEAPPQGSTGWTAPVLTRTPDPTALPGTGWTGPIDLSASVWSPDAPEAPAPQAAWPAAPPSGGRGRKEPAPETAWGVPAHEQAAEMQLSEVLPTDAILGPSSPAPDSEPEFSVDVEETEAAAPAEAAPAPPAYAADPADPEPDETPQAEPPPEQPEAHEAEAPDAWAATDDPLATGEIPLDPLTSDSGPRDPLAAQAPASEETPAGDAADLGAEVSAQELEDPTADPDGGGALESGASDRFFAEGEQPPGEAASASAEASDAFADYGLGSAVPLSPADLGTLSSIGVEPSDGVGALRLLAVLVRILNRNQMIEPDQLREEIRESIAQGTAVATTPNGMESEGSSPAPSGAGGASAET